METEACKRLEAEPTEAEGGECADADGNGVDNSDSDSEDLGPETAVDADDVEADGRQDPAPPTPPAHTGMSYDDVIPRHWSKSVVNFDSDIEGLDQETPGDPDCVTADPGHRIGKLVRDTIGSQYL